MVLRVVSFAAQRGSNRTGTADQQPACSRPLRGEPGGFLKLRGGRPAPDGPPLCDRTPAVGAVRWRARPPRPLVPRRGDSESHRSAVAPPGRWGAGGPAVASRSCCYDSDCAARRALQRLDVRCRHDPELGPATISTAGRITTEDAPERNVTTMTTAPSFTKMSMVQQHRNAPAARVDAAAATVADPTRDTAARARSLRRCLASTASSCP
mmetsp:Transcript_15286/g.40859  ORF Transcript_15286/g.40859 Transcript_15286/m.40859 type:complete len:210 (-) Transcript_15286:427-1056(-)